MIKKFIKKLIIFAIILGIIILCILSSSEKIQYMNNLDYKIELSENGEMKITENWDMYIYKTDTIFRDLKLSSKYGNIENVNVVNLDTGENLNKIDTEEYYVPEGSFYALPIEEDMFEIAWGTGLRNGFGRKRYQITYTIANVVNDYKDCQEWYWQLIGEGENAVPVSRITGTITLPKEVENIENLKVWGHGQINGNIEKVNNKEIKFDVTNLQPGAMLELRVVSQDKIFDIQNENNIFNHNYLNQIVQEETQWAEETNKNASQTKIIFVIIGLIYLIILIRYILKIIKYIKISKKENDGLINRDLKYYRDIPRENESTPNEACYLYYYNKTSLSNSSVQSNMVSSTILDLCLKKIINLTEKNEKIYVKILNQEPQNLKPDEMEIFKILKAVGKNKEEFELSELNDYAKKQYYQYSTNVNNTVNYAKNNLYKINLIDKKEEKEYAKANYSDFTLKSIISIYIFLLVSAIIMYIPIIKVTSAANFGISFQANLLWYMLGLTPLILVVTCAIKLRGKIKDKIAVLTQEGSDEKAEWKGLAEYMKDFSKLNEKEVPELIIWEKYLVYATAFGIADKAIEQMKAKYPKVFIQENWDEEKMVKEYPVIHFVSNPIYIAHHGFNPITSLNSNVKIAYKTSMAEIAAHSSSSGSGAGGGFSSRRRSAEVAGGRNGRKIKCSYHSILKLVCPA